MTYYVCFNEMLLDEAYKLAQIRGEKSDIKAADDLYIVDEILAGRVGCIDVYALDERLRKEYETIEQLENIVSEYTCRNSHRASSVSTERMVLRLKSDRCGILADVLMKHGRMKYAEQLCKKSRL